MTGNDDQSPEALEPSANPQPDDAATPFLDIRQGCVLIVLLTLIAYGSSYSNGYIWDDDAYVTENQTLRSIDGLKAIWLDPSKTPQYYPLVHTSYWIEFRFWGLHPMGYHVVNTLLHAIAACLLFLVLKRLKLPGAWLAAAVFAVHPVGVESVAWITERKNVLSAVFYFCAMLSFMKAVSWSSESLRLPKNRWYAISLGLFICALLSKTVTCSLPAVIVLLVWWRCKSFIRNDWKVLLSLIPFFIIGATMAYITVHLEKQHVGATGMEWDFSAVDRCLIAGRSLVFYMQKLVYPNPLIFFYERWEIDSGMWWHYLYPLGFGLLLVGSIVMSRRWGRGVAVGLMAFAGTLLPALGFFNVYPHRYSFVADHFQYLAMPAFIAIVVGVIHRFLCISFKGRVKQQVIIGLSGVVVVALMVQTFLRCPVYESERTLWVDTLEQNEACWAAYNNLGLILLRENRYDEAEYCFRQTIKYNPDHAKAHSNLGWLYDRLGQDDEAETYLKKAVEMRPNIPNSWLLYGNFLAKQHRYAEAIAAYRNILATNQPERVKKQFVLAAIGAGNVFMETKEYAKADLLYGKALEQDPSSLPARIYRARARVELGNRQGATDDLNVLSARLHLLSPQQRAQVGTLLKRLEAEKKRPAPSE